MRIQIRFNTEKLKSPEQDLPEWRVIADGEQRLARRVEIQVPSWTTQDELAPGLTKWHVTCEGRASWDGEVCRISGV